MPAPKPGKRFIVKCVRGVADRTITKPTGKKVKQSQTAVCFVNQDRSFEYIETDIQTVTTVLQKMGPMKEVFLWASINDEKTLRLHEPARAQGW